MPNLIWIVAAATAFGAIAGALGWRLWRDLRNRRPPLPGDWALAARPVFSAEERRVYRFLHEALPQCIVLAKLPLVRLCRPRDPARSRYWYSVLGSTHVGFAVCSRSGRVLAAIDLDEGRRDGQERAIQIKQAVFDACRVRYLRCPPDRLPTEAELRLLIPSHPPAVDSAPAPLAQDLTEVSHALALTVAQRRAQRSAMWRDSIPFQDSFFAAEVLREGAPASEPGALGAPEIGGVVYDPPTRLSA